MTDEELAREARRWDNREITPHDWEDYPDAVPRKRESVSISIRMPRTMLTILKEFARRQDVGYQVLMKRWLDDRIRLEHDRMRKKSVRVQVVSPTAFSRAATFKPPDDAALSGHPRVRS